MQKNLLYVWIVASALSFALCAIAETAGQEARTNAVIIAAENPQTLKQSNTIQSNTAFEQTRIQEKLDSYAKQIDIMRWAVTCVLTCMGFVITLALAAVGFISWKSQKEYRDSLGDIKEARRDAKEFSQRAEKSCENSQDWEQKTREKYESIEKHINKKIEEFDNKTQEKFNELDEEAQRQRESIGKRFTAFQAGQEKNFELADLVWTEILEGNPQDYKAFYNWGNCLCDWARQGGVDMGERYRLAREKYEKATQINPNFAEGFYRWGLSLKQWAENGLTPIDKHLYELACKKFKNAIDIKSDFALAYCSWANTLFNWARIDENRSEELLALACEKYQKASEIRPDYQDAFFHWGIVLGFLGLNTGRDEYYQSAEEKLLQVEKIKPGSAAYGLACTYAVMRDEEKCKYWLNVAQQQDTLPTFGQAVKNEHFEPYVNKDWFKKLWPREMDLE